MKKNMVNATHTDGRKHAFSETAWNILPTGKDGTKGGWTKDAPAVPAEVTETITKRKRKNDTDENQEQEN